MTATQPHAAPAPDAGLLRRYAATRSPDAFAALVDRYLPLIYSAAVRQTRDPHLAEDVAQATLLLLSERAGRLDPAVLPGWLMKAAHYAARNAVRQRIRRRAHEHRAAVMRPESAAPATADADAVSDVLDPALARLGDADRTAVVLRYLQDKSFADIAAHLRTTEAAAQRRVSRALEKLRTILAGRGVAIAPAALPAALAAQATHPVPSTLASHASSLASLKSPPTLLLSKGVISAMAATKVKVAATIAAVVLLVGAAVPITYHYATARPEPGPAAAAAVPVPAAPPLPVGTDMSRPVAGVLPPGMTAEPLAVMSLADKRWIRPTGGELTGLPEGANGLSPSRMRVRGATHAVLFRVVVPSIDVSWRYSLPHSGAYGSANSYDARARAHYTMVVFTPEPGTTSVPLTIDAATGPWTNCAAVPASATAPVVGSIDGLRITFDPPTQENTQVHVRCSTSQEIPEHVHDLCKEFYARDVAGRKVASRGIIGNMEGGRYDFGGPLSSLKEFRLDARPYNYHATYAPVPLAPVK